MIMINNMYKRMAVLKNSQGSCGWREDFDCAEPYQSKRSNNSWYSIIKNSHIVGVKTRCDCFLLCE